MKIFAISGSLRSASSNTAILRALGHLFPERIDYVIWDGLSGLPHFSPEMDFDASPAAVVDYRQALKDADGVVICTPEYAFGMPGVLKNALDWIVSSGELDRKPVVTISASPLPTGGEKAHAWLSQTLTALGASQLPDARLSVAAVKGKIDAEGRVTDAQLLGDLSRLAVALIRAVEAAWDANREGEELIR